MIQDAVQNFSNIASQTLWYRGIDVEARREHQPRHLLLLAKGLRDDALDKSLMAEDMYCSIIVRFCELTEVMDGFWPGDIEQTEAVCMIRRAHHNTIVSGTHHSLSIS